MMYSPKWLEIFWDNGKFVAVAEDSNGTRRNYSYGDPQTKKEAIERAKDTLFNWPLNRWERP